MGQHRGRRSDAREVLLFSKLVTNSFLLGVVAQEPDIPAERARFVTQRDNFDPDVELCTVFAQQPIIVPHRRLLLRAFEHRAPSALILRRSFEKPRKMNAVEVLGHITQELLGALRMEYNTFPRKKKKSVFGDFSP